MKFLLYMLTHDLRVLEAETFNRVSLDMRLPVWAAFLLALLAVGFAVYAYRRERNLAPLRRRVLTTLRACAYLAMLFILLQPTLKIDADGKPTGPLPVVLDRTDRMGIKDVANNPRLAAGARLRRALLARASVAPALQQVHYVYGPKVEPIPAPGSSANGQSGTNAAAFDDTRTEGAVTSLRDMINGGLREHRGVYCPGLLLLTDGANNVADYLDPTIDDIARRRTPIYVAAFGQENPRDISLDAILGEDIVFVNEKAKYFVSITQSGYSGKPIPVRAAFGAESITVPDYQTDKDGNNTFPVEFKPSAPGVFDLVVEVPPDAQESTAENNKITRRVRVIKDRIRVLMVFGWPSWDYRFLCGAFERDRRVDHHIYLQSVDRRFFKYRQDRLIEQLPTKSEDLFSHYDMIVMSRVDLATLPPAFLDLMQRFVTDEGGGLVVLSDNSDLPFSFKGTKLEAMLPVKLKAPAGPSNLSQEMFKPLDTPYRLQLTEDGQGNPLTTFDANRDANKKIWDSFPPCFELVTMVEPKPSAIPLVTASVGPGSPTYPGIAYQSYGKGTVLYLGFDSTWRWRKEYGDRYFRDFWGKVIQFLGMPHLLGESAQARLFCDRMTATVGERVLVTAEIRNRDYSPYVAESMAVTISQEGQPDRKLSLIGVNERPGIFRATVYPEEDGKLTFKLPPEFPGDPAELMVSRISREFQDAGVKTVLLTSMADKTGGELFYFGPGRTVSAATDPAQQERQRALLAAKATLERHNENPYANDAFVTQWADHILRTISEKRIPLPLVVEHDLWDTVALMTAALLLLCVEYAFRKFWYLD